jgi:hypothetical protein
LNAFPHPGFCVGVLILIKRPRGWAERIEGKWKLLKGRRILSYFIILLIKNSYSLNPQQLFKPSKLQKQYNAFCHLFLRFIFWQFPSIG